MSRRVPGSFVNPVFGLCALLSCAWAESAPQRSDPSAPFERAYALADYRGAERLARDAAATTAGSPSATHRAVWWIAAGSAAIQDGRPGDAIDAYARGALLGGHPGRESLALRSRALAEAKLFLSARRSFDALARRFPYARASGADERLVLAIDRALAGRSATSGLLTWHTQQAAQALDSDRPGLAWAHACEARILARLFDAAPPEDALVIGAAACLTMESPETALAMLDLIPEPSRGHATRIARMRDAAGQWSALRSASSAHFRNQAGTTTAPTWID